MQAWINDCLQNHSSCHKPLKGIAIRKRLLDLRDDSIVLREHVSENTVYACLSHCWGNSAIVKTTKANIHDFKMDIQFSSLSRTFQEAVEICRRLGVWFLWIDSLCIIQDDDEDWRYQAAQMADIYEQARFTVAATKAQDGSKGCFSIADPGHISKAVPGWEGLFVRRHVRAFPREYYEYTGGPINVLPLFDRGWTYQEQILSPRLLHFCDSEVVWQCKRGIKQEGGGGLYDPEHDDRPWNNPSE
jgi:hypothetical protein